MKKFVSVIAVVGLAMFGNFGATLQTSADTNLQELEMVNDFSKPVTEYKYYGLKEFFS